MHSKACGTAQKPPYPSSFGKRSAFATRVRGHWQIENQLHWRLDVILAEDDAHIRVNHGPENMAVLRHMAINLLKHEPSPISIQSKRLQAACANEYLEKVIKM